MSPDLCPHDGLSSLLVWSLGLGVASAVTSLASVTLEQRPACGVVSA